MQILSYIKPEWVSKSAPSDWCKEVDFKRMLEAAVQRATFTHDVGKHGRDAMGLYLGNPNAHNLGAMLFGPLMLRALRSKNRFSATSVDQLPHMFASWQMFGHQLFFPVKTSKTASVPDALSSCSAMRCAASVSQCVTLFL